MITQAQQDIPEIPVTALCWLFGVSRSGYYARAANPQDAPSEVALRDAIEDLVLDFPGYGYRRVTKRVLRIMREELRLCQLRRRFVVTTASHHGWRTSPNRLAGLVLDRLDQAWVADITSIRRPTTFVYLAAILDAYSRRGIGWELSRTMDTALTVAAVERAVQLRQPAPGVIHHSDRGGAVCQSGLRGTLGAGRAAAKHVSPWQPV